MRISDWSSDVCSSDLTALDGLRVREGGGWWLLRASNTEAALTLRCEAPDELSLKALTARLTAQLVASGLTPPTFSAVFILKCLESPGWNRSGSAGTAQIGRASCRERLCPSV